MKFTKILSGVAQRTKVTRSKRTKGTVGSTAPRSKAGAEKSSPNPTPRRGQVQISYEPAFDGDADPGEIVWAWIPYEDDPAEGKDRPCLVIGRIDDRLAAVALTSKESGRPGDRLAVGTGPWDHERRPSWAKIDRVIALRPDHVRREGAIFPAERFDSVVAATAGRRAEIQYA